MTSVASEMRRRQSGNRRTFQGMRFSSRSPCHGRLGKITPLFRIRKRISIKTKNTIWNKVDRLRKGFFSHDLGPDIQDQELAFLTFVGGFGGPEFALNLGKSTSQIIKCDNSNPSLKELGPESNLDHPSKFLTMCLNCIQTAMLQNGLLNEEDGRPFFANAWGNQFWNYQNCGKDVLDNSRTGSTIEKIAWVAATAADTISRKEKEGVSVNSPFLLYLVPSQDKIREVSQVCKPLEEVGIQTMSLDLDLDVPLDHQIDSLKEWEPEFIISTPETLLELLPFNSVDISEISMMVIDGIEDPFTGTYSDAIDSIQEFISGNPLEIVFCKCNPSVSACSNN